MRPLLPFILIAVSATATHAASWVTIVREDFTSGMGKFWPGFAWGNTHQGASPDCYYPNSNAWVSGGYLWLQADSSGSNGKRWDGGAVNSYNNMWLNPYWNGGTGYRIRAQIQIPAGGQGLNPAMWLLPNESNFPWPPEIDVFEVPGGRSNGRKVFWTEHYASDGAGGTLQHAWNDDVGFDLSGGEYIYELQWMRDRLHFAVQRTNGTIIKSWNYNGPTVNRGMYVILSVEVANRPDWHGTPPSGNWTKHMKVNWFQLDRYQ
jgi:beta-glucanase (GH16 family)